MSTLPKIAVYISEPTTITFRVYSTKISHHLERYQRTFLRFGYDSISPSINNRNFKISKRGEFTRDVVLIKFGGSYSSTQGINDEMTKLGFRPADLLELLEFGNVNRALQKEFPIFALGSSWARKGSSRIRFPNLGASISGDRRVNLSELSHEEIAYAWFASIQK